jgi:two-component system chemotaxis response regulator CheB
MDISTLVRELEGKIQVAARVDMGKVAGSTAMAAVPGQNRSVSRSSDLLLIGTSTGGPPALQTILSRLPGSFPCPILMVQHMPAGFTASLAERLNRVCQLGVKEAEQGELLLPGKAYLAEAGKHLKVKRQREGYLAVLDNEPQDTLHRPSVDVLFASAAAAAGERCLAFVLTGMGADGAAGARAIKGVGGRVFVESEESAIVFGMPKAVMEAVPVDGVVPLGRCADVIMAEI